MHEQTMMNHKTPQLCKQQEYVLNFSCNYFSVLILLSLLKRQTIINPTNMVQLLLTYASLAMEEECKKKSMRKNCWVE